MDKTQIYAGLSALGVAALAYHGYKRNCSVGGALKWGLLGGLVWPITGAVALAQGFGKPAPGGACGR